MPAYFNQGFFVEKTAWHKLGVLLDSPPATRELAKTLAGHDYIVVERVNADLGGVRGNTPLTVEEFEAAKFDRAVNIARVGGDWFALSVNPDKKGLRRGALTSVLGPDSEESWQLTRIEHFHVPEEPGRNPGGVQWVAVYTRS